MALQKQIFCTNLESGAGSKHTSGVRTLSQSRFNVQMNFEERLCSGPPKDTSQPRPMKVTVFGNGVFAGVTRDLRMDTMDYPSGSQVQWWYPYDRQKRRGPQKPQ